MSENRADCSKIGFSSENEAKKPVRLESRRGKKSPGTNTQYKWVERKPWHNTKGYIKTTYDSKTVE